MTTRFSLGDLLNLEFEEEKKPRKRRQQRAPAMVVNPLAVAVAETVLASTPVEVARTMLTIAQIRKDGDTQPRGGLNEERVKEYEQALDEGEELPPVDIVFDGTDYWLWDGFHRVEGAMRQGRIEIAVKVTYGTLSEAQWLSYSANKKHGLNRTSEDKARAVQRALRHPKGRMSSNREVARHCGVDEKTVRNYREKMEAAAEIPQSLTRSGADGKEYGIGNKQGKIISTTQQKNTGADFPHLRPSRYVLPSRDENLSPSTSPTLELPELKAPATTLPSDVPLQPKQYAPIFLLEQRVYAGLRAFRLSVMDATLAAELRQMVKLGWQKLRLGEVIAEQLQDLVWRANDVEQAINNVANQLEQQGKPAVGPGLEQGQPLAGNSQPLPFPVIKQEPLRHSERLAAIAGELIFWQGALVRLAMVGELTGQHSVTLALRREVERVIALYQQEKQG